MKQFLCLTLLLSLLYSCRKEEEPPPYDDTVDHHVVPPHDAYIAGTVYDGLTGLVVPAASVKIFQAQSIDQQNALTDSLGHYCTHKHWGGYHYWTPSVTDSVDLTAYGDHKYGTLGNFASTELAVDDTIFRDIYIYPVGFLTLHAVDTLPAEVGIAVYCTEGVNGLYTLHFYKELPLFVDTTLTLDVIPNKTVKTWYYTNGITTSPVYMFIPSGDTVNWNISY